MHKLYLHTIKTLVTALVVTLFFSCKNNFQEVQKIGVSQNEPIGVAIDINPKYVDSGRVTADLVSPKMIDYSNNSFPYTEFPDGVTLYLYDDKDGKITIIADYAISYGDTNIIDMQGNVVVTTPKKDTLFAEQLFYDTQKEWVFTNLPVKHRQGNDVTMGNGFDANRDFSKAEVLEFTGLYTVQE